MKVLVTGANGMLGTATVEYLSSVGDDVIALTKGDLDIADTELVRNAVKSASPDTVINCAAWTDVDGCETDHEKNYGVHARGPENLAIACREIGASLITVSTDYVFDGTKGGFYTQRDDPNPTSKYGSAKLAGERLAQAALARTMVVRVGWLFGSGGKNFLSKLPELLRSGQRLKVIADSYGTPTYAPDMAKRLRELAILDLPGIYHMANSGKGTSYAGFARAIGEDSSLIEEVAAATLLRPAPRPQNSRLRCLLAEAIKLEPLPDWEEALQHFVNQTASTEVASQ
ncbi:MAG TPA: dTDP-4-dehydrorhamnose reductase [Pyrinomonadaceae bacterium]|jgi:dTDP-4-dehydrorhamnose reductase|nr:dTDP-4-dehydrorhamnose reductase [Pyrinomonadaceae bacterium]